jgi:hypothetical protein
LAGRQYRRYAQRIICCSYRVADRRANTLKQKLKCTTHSYCGNRFTPQRLQDNYQTCTLRAAQRFMPNAMRRTRQHRARFPARRLLFLHNQ